jgi:hypothetical protein
VTVPLTGAERERLAKLLGLLGSDHDGERAAAGLQASKLIRAKGLTWADVLGAGQLPRRLEAPARSSPWTGRPASHLGDLRLVLANLVLLNDWEREFVGSIAQQRRWSDKQVARLGGIVAKGRARAGGGQP